MVRAISSNLGVTLTQKHDTEQKKSLHIFSEKLIISLYLVEYPFAIGAFRQVPASRNHLNFNGYG
jgi:hypothetical protein